MLHLRMCEGYLETGESESSFKEGQEAMKYIEKHDKGSKSELWCNYLLLKAYEAENYVEKIEKTARRVLELSEIHGKEKERLDVFKFTGLKSLAKFFLMFGKGEESMKFVEQLLVGIESEVKRN